MFTSEERAEIKRAREEWQANARANKICEVITVSPTTGRLDREVFPTIEAAHAVYPWVTEERAMRGHIDGKDAWRFESTKAYERLSR